MKALLLVTLFLLAAVGLLAFIYLPSYLEARLRMKTQETKSQMRLLAGILESVRLDQFPTTVSELRDRAAKESGKHDISLDLMDPCSGQPFLYSASRKGDIIRWRIIATGLDGEMQSTTSSLLLYDATNGMISTGDIVRLGERKVLGNSRL